MQASDLCLNVDTYILRQPSLPSPFHPVSFYAIFFYCVTFPPLLSRAILLPPRGPGGAGATENHSKRPLRGLCEDGAHGQRGKVPLCDPRGARRGGYCVCN